MIKVNTVLILGAGASHDFGFPLGDELKNRVISILSNQGFQRDLKNGYGTRIGIEYWAKGFVDALSKDKALTIDRFLAKSDDSHRRLGKIAIAKVILDCENDKLLFQNENSWYKRLYSIIHDYPNVEKLEANQLSVITFNYDRSLEHFLYEQLTNDYRPQQKDKILDQLKKIPIVHIHGRVNMLPWEDSQKGFQYASGGFVPHLFEVAEKMILPTDDNSSIIANAHQLIDKAETIYFFGFGYEPINLRKLDINLISKCNRVFSTSHNLPIAKQTAINSLFGRKVINFSSKKVYDFFMDLFNPDGLV